MYDFPPRNRRPVELPVLRIEVEDAHGVRVFDPNGAILWAIYDKGTEKLSPLKEGTVAYRSRDMEIFLTPDALDRLIRLDLRPDEYFRLRDRFGMAHEWHDDYYDIDTGEALQPNR
jgi:hypothetical protein